MTRQRPVILTRARARAWLFAWGAAGLLSACGVDQTQQTDSDDAITRMQTSAADTGSAGQAPQCDTTWKAIQKSILEPGGCVACHGGTTKLGGLDLSGPAALSRMINQPAQAPLTTPMSLIMPGEQALSFFYLKLAAATNGSALPTGGGAPMPVGKPPVGAKQLEAVRLWIRAGAPESGVVAGTQDLLDCTQPADADPNKAPRPPVPPAEVGFQHAAGPWTLRENSDTEVCFATYYDLTDSAPEWSKSSCTIGGVEQTCVNYNRRELSQDAQSHHSIINVYAGDVLPSDPSWGPFRCAGGELAGTTCDPTKLDVSAKDGGAQCGSAGVCQAAPRKMFGCTGFGPQNKEASSVSAGGSQAPVSADRFPAGVFARLPVKGYVLWNSHGFNLTKKETTVEQFNTFWYARPEERTYLVHNIFTGGTPRVNIDVAPFADQEVCRTYTLPRYARLTELSSHAHKRAILWRSWLPPNEPTCGASGCAPSTKTPDYLSKQYNDPVIRYFDPPMVFDQEDAESRTIKFCALYDNGKNDPTLLKRKSQLPDGAACVGPLFCASGAKAGQQCSADAECGGARCEACAVRWGLTTEDEMFFLMGNYYVVPPTP